MYISQALCKLDLNAYSLLLQKLSFSQISPRFSLWFTSDFATLTVTKNDTICEATLTCTFTQEVDLILANQGEVVFDLGGSSIFKYSTSLTDGNSAAVTSATAVATKTAKAIAVTVKSFDVTYEGDWTCKVVGSTSNDAQSSVENALATSAACTSELSH